MAWPNDKVSNTPARYLFKLFSTTDEIICNNEPLEWKSGAVEYKRDLESGGVFVSFAADSLTFVGNGAEFIKKIYDAYGLGPNAKCTLKIYWWKNSTRTYIEFPSQFDINFNFFERVKIGRFYTGVKVKAVNSSTQTKLDNRQDVDVDVTKLVSIGGFNIAEYPNLSTLKKIDYEATYVAYSALLQDLAGIYRLYHPVHIVAYTSVPVKKISSQFTEVQEVAYVSGITNLLAIPSFFKSSLYDKTLTIHYWLQMRVSNRYTGTSEPFRVQILEVDPAGEIVGAPYIDEGFGRDSRTYIYNDQVDISITAGNDLKCVVKSEGIDATYTAYCEYTSLAVEERIASTEAVSLEGLPIYETIERVCQHVLDVQYPIYTDFFSRTDVAYRADGTKYTTESQLRFAHVQGGMNLRGAKLDNPDVSLAMNFKDLFATLKAVYNVGYSLETNFALFGDYQPRIRIEEYSYFFQNTEIVLDPPLSQRITKFDIQSQVMPELVPVDIKSGYDNYEYLSINGRSEPNTTNQRTTVMGTSTKFENIAKFRFDTKGILDNISNPIGENATTDTKGDNAIFIIKTQKNGTGWKPEKAENIGIVGDTSLFKDDLMNRYFTPTRILIRSGNRLTPGLMKPDVQATKLTFQKSDKTSTLETLGTAQSGDDQYQIAENDDITVSTLPDPILLPTKHTINVEFTKRDLELVQANPTGYLVYSSTVSGFLLNLKMKNDEDRADLTINERFIP